MRAEDARGFVDRLDRQRFDDFHDQPFGGSRTGRERRLEAVDPVGGAQGGDGNVDGDPQCGFGGEAVERQFEHAVIELRDQAEFFRDRKQTSGPTRPPSS